MEQLNKKRKGTKLSSIWSVRAWERKTLVSTYSLVRILGSCTYMPVATMRSNSPTLNEAKFRISAQI